jgi:uncharacterized protein (DUF1501 family)
VPIDRPELAFVCAHSQAAMATLDRVASVAAYAVGHLSDTGLGQALRAVGRAMAKGVGTRVFYVTIGGFDTHSAQNVNATNGRTYTLMATLNDALLAFCNDLKNQGLFEDTCSSRSRSSGAESARTAPVRRRAPTMAPPA